MHSTQSKARPIARTTRNNTEAQRNGDVQRRGASRLHPWPATPMGVDKPRRRPSTPSRLACSRSSPARYQSPRREGGGPGGNPALALAIHRPAMARCPRTTSSAPSPRARAPIRTPTPSSRSSMRLRAGRRGDSVCEALTDNRNRTARRCATPSPRKAATWASRARWLDLREEGRDRGRRSATPDELLAPSTPRRGRGPRRRRVGDRDRARRCDRRARGARRRGGSRSSRLSSCSAPPPETPMPKTAANP